MLQEIIKELTKPSAKGPLVSIQEFQRMWCLIDEKYLNIAKAMMTNGRGAAKKVMVNLGILFKDTQEIWYNKINNAKRCSKGSLEWSENENCLKYDFEKTIGNFHH